jgi:GT2 family glycosyltransferase
MKVSIVIPNFNGALLLKKNLPKVLTAADYYQKSSGNKVEIIVTDDGSTDSSATVIKESGLPIIFLAHKQNSGFAGNVNRGVKKATGDILVLLNTDVAPMKDFLTPLLKHFEDKKVFAVGCMDLSREGDKEIRRGRGVGRWEKGFLMHSAGSMDQQLTLWASGGSSAFRSDLWRELRGLYEIYDPFYWEDIDLSYRALKAGYAVIFEPGSVVIHSHDEGAIRTNFSDQTITATAYRNQILFVWLNITDRDLLISHILWIPTHLVEALKRGDFAFWRGFLQALLLLPRVFPLRAGNSRTFRVSDRQVLEEHR